MPTDLITRARSAETRDEECSAIRAAVCHFIDDAAAALPLIDIIVAVRSGRAPRAVLLGVVAALVPDNVLWSACGYRDKGGSATASLNWPGTHDAQTIAASAPTPAIALLTAILEAAGQTGGEVGNG